jgi:hypothetical protein
MVPGVNSSPNDFYSSEDFHIAILYTFINISDPLLTKIKILYKKHKNSRPF